MKEQINILVVDDDPVILKSAWKALSAEGYNVEGVLSGKKALQKMKQNYYRLVFTDLKMPGIDGISLIKWIKHSRPDIGIVVITGNPLPETIKEAHELGILSHMMKPFTPKMLKEVVKKTIELTASNTLQKEPKEEYPPAMLEELDTVIHQYRKNPGHAIRVLLQAQEIFGHLSPAIQKHIAQELNMYPSEIRSIVSFYSCFRTKPEGKHAPCYISGTERAWNSVTWMTGKKAADAVNEFIRCKQT